MEERVTEREIKKKFLEKVQYLNKKFQKRGQKKWRGRNQIINLGKISQNYGHEF